jgi:hypothetical protein
MSHKQSIIAITRIFGRAAAVGLMSLFVFIGFAFGHGGFDHVTGTVVTLANNVLTVKTAKGNVDVKLDEKTELTKNDKRAEPSDLKPGVRVVVDVPEGSKTKIAHSVKIGIANSSPEHAHDAHQ